MAENNQTGDPGDVPADLGPHGAVHLNTPPAPAPSPDPSPGAPPQGGQQQQPDAGAVPSMPDGGAEKFYDAKTGAYNWEAHAKEAEFRLAQRGTPPTEPGGTPQDTPPASDEQAKTAVEAAGLDWSDVSERAVLEGKLTDEQMDALVSKVGLPREDVEGYVAYVHEMAVERVDNVKTAFGGEQGFQEIAQWAQENLSERERDAYNTMLNGPEWQIAVNSMLAQAGRPPAEFSQPIAGPNQAGTPSGGAQGYQSEAEMIADMRKPEYKSDPEFRRQVTARVAQSKFDMNPRRHTSGI